MIKEHIFTISSNILQMGFVHDIFLLNLNHIIIISLNQILLNI